MRFVLAIAAGMMLLSCSDTSGPAAPETRTDVPRIHLVARPTAENLMLEVDLRLDTAFDDYISQQGELQDLHITVEPTSAPLPVLGQSFSPRLSGGRVTVKLAAVPEGARLYVAGVYVDRNNAGEEIGRYPFAERVAATAR